MLINTLGTSVIIVPILPDFKVCLCYRCFKQKVEAMKKGTKKHEQLEKELDRRKDFPNLAAQPTSTMNTPKKAGGGTGKDHNVIITEQGVSDANDALNSLFSTPTSNVVGHEAAAVVLNPPPFSPKRHQNQMTNSSPAANGAVNGSVGGKAAVLNHHNKFQPSLSSTAESTPLHMNGINGAPGSKFDSALSTPVRSLPSPNPVTAGAGLQETSDSSSECNSKFVSCNSILMDNETVAAAVADGFLANGAAIGGGGGDENLFKPSEEATGTAADTFGGGYNHSTTVAEPGYNKTGSNSPIPYR